MLVLEDSSVDSCGETIATSDPSVSLSMTIGNGLGVRGGHVKSSSPNAICRLFEKLGGAGSATLRSRSLEASLDPECIHGCDGA
jgi:hypothetical protein